MAVTVAVALVALVAGAEAQETLTLRVSNATVRPAHEAAIILRTYASRPIDQGQVCFRSPLVAGPGPGQPGMTLREAIVWSALDDTLLDVRVDTSVDPPAIVLTFQSPSGTINTSDGPLAALIFDVDPSVAVGTELPITLDLAQTMLIGNDGRPIAIQPVDGRLRVVAESEPFGLGAEGDQVEAGMPLIIGASFKESRTVSRGQIGLVLPPALASRTLTAEIDSRFGDAVWTLDDTTPGLLVVSFDSRDASLGRIPGQFLRLTVDSAGVPSGVYPIELDPASTFLIDPQGINLPVTFEMDEIVIVNGGFFRGDFEQGDFSDWSAVIGGE